MDLYATGFNAWNQLKFSPSNAADEPDDLFTFTKVLTGRTIERPISRLSYTTVQCDEFLHFAGPKYLETAIQSNARQCANSYLFAEAADGTILTVEEIEGGKTSGAPSHRLVRYHSLENWKSRSDGQSWPCESHVKQISAYETGFVVLHEDGRVCTLGDPRFEECLGRETDESSPASEPGEVHHLSDLGESVVKVVGGGFAVGLLTEGGSLYIWGAESVGSNKRVQPFPSLNIIPNYVEVDRAKDVQDVAFGESHAIALTTDGCVYVIGENTNGQVGTGKEFKSTAKTWVKADLKIPPESRVVAVAAGPRSSLILMTTENT